ncbi:hypothetical protein [Streptodolium elevatio]
MAATLLTHSPAIAATPSAGPHAASSPEVAQTSAEAGEQTPEEAASEQARRTGVAVPVPELTTETDTVAAQPEGGFTLTRTSSPERIKRGGGWADLDATLSKDSSGAIAPAVSWSGLTLSPGGTGPLARLNHGGKELAFTWPTALPAPVLDGASAVYRNVLPDVDLRVTASTLGGFTHTLVVKNAAAAQNPGLNTLRLGVATTGLTVAAGNDGALQAVDASGTPVFTAPPATMWDSRTTPVEAPAKAGAQAPASTTAAANSPAAAEDDPEPTSGAEVSTAEGPGAYAEHTELAVTVTANSLTLTPDQGMLDSPATVYPVYIDPTWNPNPGVGSTWTQAGCPTATNWSAARDPGVGYQQYTNETPACVGNQRAYYQFYGGFSSDRRTVTGIEFDATQTKSSSWDCNKAYPVDLWSTPGTIGPSTNWSNRPEGANDSNRTWLASMPMTGAANQGGTACSKLLADYKIGSQHFPMMLDRLDETVVTFSLTGKENVADDQFKRFGRNAALRVHYNSWVNDPADLWIQPAPQNPACGGWIGATNQATGGIKLSAVVSDPDNTAVTANFHLWDATSGPTLTDYGWGPPISSGSRAEVAVGTLADGHRYDWYVRAGDGDGRSDSLFIRGCSFGVDKTAPNTPTVTSTDYPESGTAPSSLSVNKPGTFTLSASDNASGVWKFEYALNNTIPVGNAASVPANGGTTATLTLTPNTWGTNLLRVQAVDMAGNRSQPRTYAFYVPYDPTRTSVAGDITGDGLPDLVMADPSGKLVMYQAKKDPGILNSAVQVSNPANAPDSALPSGDGKGWSTAVFSHTTGNGNDTDQLWAYKSGALLLYPSSLDGTLLPPDKVGPEKNGDQYFAYGNAIEVNKDIVTCVGACDSYSYDWSRVRQIAALADATGDGRPDLLTVEVDGTGNGSLWFYTGGSATGSLVEARRIGTGGWQNMTLTVPGDTTGDGLPDLWARDTDDGALYQYPSRKNPAPDITAYGSISTRTRINGGLTAAEYPTVASDGNITGSTHKDLWVVAPDGRVSVFPGRETGGGYPFESPMTVTPNITSWQQCETVPAVTGKSLCGPVLTRYRSLSEAKRTEMGLPTSGVLTTANNRSRYVNFADNASMHWTPEYGTVVVNGTIRTAWGNTGWQAGYLGYPKTDHYPVAGGTRVDFEGGYIRWNAATNTAADHTYTDGETSAAHITVTGDFNADGRDDLATVHDYLGGSAALWTSLTTSSGGAAAPFESWKTAPNNWWITQAKWVAGEFVTDTDGKRRDDIAALYRYSDGRVKLFTFRANPDGGFTYLGGSWEQPAGWDWNRTTLMAGNANGTGADEVVAVQGTADGRFATYTFTATGTGVFNAPVKGYEETNTGFWYTDQSHFALGDANNDGRADIIGTYIYTDNTLKTFTSLANTGGTYPAFTIAGWASGPGSWYHSAMQATAGDANGDGRDDLVVMYDYGNGDMGLWTFTAAANGNLTAPIAATPRTGPGNWWADRSVPHTGDTDADGRDDLITLYRYNDGGFSRFVYTAQNPGTGGFNPKTSTWSAAPGLW